ncbi:MAG: hypothetical protein KIT38_09975 [Gemmatimonadaceae bacterium]|nr:hypothetical protein [Gemmatimonadaceae bacterium]
MVKQLVLLGLLSAMLPNLSGAQEREPRLVAGIRSALATAPMTLSGLDPAFDDLAPDGPEGPHMSGFFLMYALKPYLRVGVETLVASSDKDQVTTMNYQAAGPVVEFRYGRTWYVSAGVHGGGLIVNAMARQGAAPSQGASTGAFFKGDGAFLAPYVDVGRRVRGYEVGVFAKQVNVFGEKSRGGISDFSATFLGLRLAASPRG